ncbi:voltage-gated potassium channel [Aureococcus anophagefferens]|nr:voltage-gated potassium channel [Aureococcus anophagefferens]
MVNSGFGACPPTTSTIEVGLYLSCRISGSLLGPILPAAAMAEANGGGGSDAVVAVAPDPEAADAARSLGALEVHVDALMGAAAAIEDLVASLGAPAATTSPCSSSSSKRRRAAFGATTGRRAARAALAAQDARDERRSARLSRWASLRASVADQRSSKAAKPRDLSAVVDRATGKVTASAAELEDLLATRTVSTARPPMSDAVGRQLFLRLRLIDMRRGREAKLRRAWNLWNGRAPAARAGASAAPAADPAASTWQGAGKRSRVFPSTRRQTQRAEKARHVEAKFDDLVASRGAVAVGDVASAMDALGRPAPAAAVARARHKARLPLSTALNKGDFVTLCLSIEECRSEAFDEACRKQKAMLLTLEEETVFDAAIMTLLVFIFIFLPVELAFEEIGETAAVEYLGLSIDLYFCLDILKTFNVGFVNYNDVLVMDRYAVARRYASTWLLIDLTSSIPISHILKLFINENGGALVSGKKALKLARLAKLSKLLKLMRATQFVQRLRTFLFQVLDDLGIRISDAVFKLVRLLLYLLVLAHWLGCLFYLLCRLYGFPSESWVVRSGLVDKHGGKRLSVSMRYTWSLYKILASFVQIAFAEPAVSQQCLRATGWCRVESWVTLLCLYIGTVFFAMLVSNMAAIIANANVGSRNFEEKLNAALEYMRMRKFPRMTMDRVKNYYVRFMGGKFFDETSILQNLNPELRKEISLYNTRSIRPKTPLLRNSPERFFATLAIHLRPTSFFDGDVVFSEGAQTGAMFFISQGFCEILLRAAHNRAVRVLAAGCYFGEVATLLGTKRTATIRAMGMLELYALGGERLVEACSDFPDIAAYLREVALNRITVLRQFDASADIDATIDEAYVDGENAQTPLYQSYMVRMTQRLSQIRPPQPKSMAGRLRSMNLKKSLRVSKVSPNGKRTGDLAAAARASAEKHQAAPRAAERAGS